MLSTLDALEECGGPADGWSVTGLLGRGKAHKNGSVAS